MTAAAKPARRDHLVTAGYIGGGFGEPRSAGRKAAIEMFDLHGRIRISTTARVTPLSLILMGTPSDS